jgi:crotonobetainyl-CoA:carnitine CoA-transferase CaiB-like acyl-CoA transferase
VLTLNEVVALPHLRERGTVRPVSDPLLGMFDIPGPPARFSAWQIPTDLKADVLGEHNEEVLRDLLGMSDTEIARLYADKVPPLLLDEHRFGFWA